MMPRILNLVLPTICVSCALLAENGEIAMLAGPALSDEVVTTFGKPALMPDEIGLAVPQFAPRSPKSPTIAVGLSAVFPGLGHLYLGETGTAGGLIGSTGLGAAGVGFGVHPESPTWVFSTGRMTVQTAWYYGIYSAYRDVRAYNGSQYAYKMPTDTFVDLTTAPFTWSVIKKPEVWGGLLGSLAVATGVGYLASRYMVKGEMSASVARSLSPVFAFPVGIGEEAFFRGFLQSALSEWLNPWSGIALSSVAFGAAHLWNVRDASLRTRQAYSSIVVPWLTLFGAYAGWMTVKNRSLKESVALHAWYDFIIMAGAAAGQAAIGKRADFGMTFGF